MSTRFWANGLDGEEKRRRTCYRYYRTIIWTAHLEVKKTKDCVAGLKHLHVSRRENSRDSRWMTTPQRSGAVGSNLRLTAYLTLPVLASARGHSLAQCLYVYADIHVHCIVLWCSYCCVKISIAIYWKYPRPNPVIPPWTSCLKLEKLLQFSTSVIFFFLSLLSISSQAKEMGFIHFLPLILNCKLQKYLFKKSTPVPGDLAGHHLWSLGWRAYCWSFEKWLSIT